MGYTWDDFDKFENMCDKYMSPIGEGETVASQIVTAVTKLVYKWFNDGDVYDNRYYMTGWANDLSSYANWLYDNVPETQIILDRISKISCEDEYEKLLYDLCELTMNENYLKQFESVDKIGTIYDHCGQFEYEECSFEDEEEDY